MGNRYILHFLIALGLIFNAAQAKAQNRGKISGTVTDAQSGETLPGVNILVKGTTIGASTDADGQYELEVESLQDTLVVSFVGYQTQELPIGGRNQIDIALQSQAITGEEMVVVGYGTQKKENLTGSVSSVNSDDFNKGFAKGPSELIQGKVPGLDINHVGDNPAGGYSLNIRGIGTINGNDSPLIIIDGVEGSLSDVAPQNIENISVLKDASASAIYGTRASSGVVIIETKSPKANEDPILEISSYVTMQKITKKLPLLSANEYRSLADQGIQGTTDYGASTNWSDQVFRDVPLSSVNNIRFSAGNNQTSYVANLTYKRIEGLLKRSDDNAIRGQFRINHSMFDGKLNLAANTTVEKGWRYAGIGYGRVLKGVYSFNPTRPIRNKDGTYSTNGDNGSFNPVSLLQETNGTYQEGKTRLVGDVTYSPISNLTLKVQGSNKTVDGLNGYSRTKANLLSSFYGLNGFASRNTSKFSETIVNITANYTNSYKNHNYKILGGYTWKESVYEQFSAENQDFATDAVGYNNLGLGLGIGRGEASVGSGKNKSNLLGYFVRLNYDYQERYLLTASLRREASSKFGNNNKWGLFPAVSLGWNVSRESFMNSAEFINRLKIRGGVGITGSEPGSPYNSLSLLRFGNNILYQGEYISTIEPANNPNPNLQWEERTEYNLGLDFGFFENRISGSLDVYRRKTNNLLYPLTVPTPPYLYGTLLANTGTLKNEGVELHLSTIPVQNSNFQWESVFNYSTNRNKLVSLSNDVYTSSRNFFDTGGGDYLRTNTHRISVGKEVGNFYGYKTVGVTEDGYWLVETNEGKNVPIRDAGQNDKQIIGNGVPDFQLNWNNSLNYRNWNFKIALEGEFGFQILNGPRTVFNLPTFIKGQNVLKGTFDKVYGERPLSINQTRDIVSYFVEDGDYLKIRNITLGYNFEVNNLGIFNNARIYASGSNLYTLTGYSGLDPAGTTSGLNAGYDPVSRFPTTRKFTLGVSLQF